MNKRIAFIGILIAAIVGSLYLRSNTSENRPEPWVIFTQVPETSKPVMPNGEDILPDYEDSRIVRLNYKNPAQGLEVLTPDFNSAASPFISYDNERIVFSGKQNKNDPWQIWLMNIDGTGKKKVLESSDNSLTPAFLPDGRIVFSRERNDSKIGISYSLFTMNEDGSELHQITFHPHRDIYSSVLHDGRISMVSQQVYPEKKGPLFMVLRPDGTNARTFYNDRSDFQVKSIIRETPDQQLVFVQGNRNVDELVSLSYADPGNPPKVIASYPSDEIQSADILDSGRLVVASESSKDGVFGLYTMNFEGEEELIYTDRKYHSVEPVAVRQREVPKKLPSSISNEKGFGILVSQNVNRSQIPVEGDPETEYIRVLGIDSTLEEVTVADDGSFYLELQSEIPVRFQSLNEKKEVLRGPSSWIWLRTDERRGCVGCHADKAISPRNLVPEAIHNQPVRVTDTTRITDDSQVQAVREVLNKKEALNFEN